MEKNEKEREKSKSHGDQYVNGVSRRVNKNGINMLIAKVFVKRDKKGGSAVHI